LVTNLQSSCKDSSSVNVAFADNTIPEITRCSSEYTLTTTKDATGSFYTFKQQDTTYLPKAIDGCSKTDLNYTFTVNNGTETNINQFVGYRLNADAPAALHWRVYDKSGNINDQCVSNISFEYELKVPSAFSPNGDNVNDTWEIDFLSDYPDCTVKVYNRWGMLIYESQGGYKAPWNGTYKGKVLPVDSYYYIINIGKDNKVLKGNVTIVY